MNEFIQITSQITNGLIEYKLTSVSCCRMNIYLYPVSIYMTFKSNGNKIKKKKNRKKQNIKKTNKQNCNNWHK